MSVSRFALQLTLITLGTFLVFQGIHQFALSAYADFAWQCIGFFVVFSLVMYISGYFIALSKNPHFFTSLIMAFMLLKMLFSIVLIYQYVESSQPPTKFYLIPFFLNYLIYTIFETYFMAKLGKMKRL